jgi:chromosome segregation ATPase
MPNVEKEKDKIIDLPSDGPNVEVTLPEETVKEGAQDVTVPEVKPEGEVEIKEAPKKETETKELIQEDTKPEAPKQEKEKELEQYGEGVKKRIAKLTKRMRESERQRDEATRYARSVLTEQKTLKERLSKLDTGYVSEMQNRITSGLEAAQSKLASARENSDIKSEVNAQKEIAKLGYEEARLAEMKLNQEAKTKETKEKSELNQQTTTQQAPQRPRPDARATEWAQKNEWFGSDNAMTYTAFDMHKKLVEEEGYDPQSEDYYGELDRRIKLEFPHKFGNVTEQTTKPTQTVASATRNVKRGTGRKTVTLTSSQVAIAKKLNVPLEEYAKQLNVVEE